MPFFSDNGFGLGHPWFETVMELREGQFPSKEALEFGLRSKEPVPDEVREFLADFISGKSKAPPGRPRINWLVREMTSLYVRDTHQHIKEIMKDEDRSERSGDLLERTLKALEDNEFYTSLETLRDIVHRRGAWKQG